MRPSPRDADRQGQGDHTRYDLLIIGAGPAGLVAAREAVAAGARVALIESRHIGGNCLNEGCIHCQLRWPCLIRAYPTIIMVTA
ncbi:FAD-dependent oxidoreductase [Thiorhodococcus mannitoliphagus]|uniref:Dihydrolipoamide dehydrogenase n=1 Tax=Thiorhodococcus mannitoliphagus TaxID=329406 RepID=A0A6P1DZ02_9GAMM|nr:FAD-dependent oxidoreductase [Thiorhodococcus mannitoliphagus]